VLGGSILSRMLRLTREQVREIDRRAIEEYGIPGIVLMENAARAVAQTALEMMPDSESLVWVICGAGNNGGDGFAVARHLHNSGRLVQTCLAVTPGSLKGDALINYQILSKMKHTPIFRYEEQPRRLVHPTHITHLVIDALFGTGLTRPPQPPFSTIIEEVNSFGVPVLAVDVPSGLDCDTGEPLGACIRAERTVTFVAEKVGFANPASKQYTGEVTVGDIGCPRELIRGYFTAE
jgi:NAD(P)H-hydrate epimerase